MMPPEPRTTGATVGGWSEQQTEELLCRFRQWLREAGAELEAIGPQEPSGNGPFASGPLPSRPVGLLPLVEQFTALRHELKLQTKSARGLAEQTQSALSAAQEAIAMLRSAEAAQAQAVQRANKPPVEALVELDEALQRGRAAIDTARRRVLEDLVGQLREELDRLFRSQPAWRRWLCGRWHQGSREILIQRAAGLYRDIFDSLVEGYGLILNRLQRAMSKAELYRIECVGKTVDPNTMTVIEVIDDPLRPPGLVIEEVRPGYYWKDKVFRCAEVRAVRGRTS